MTVPEHLAGELEMLQRAFPDQLSPSEYRALLRLLYDEFSERNFAAVVGALVGIDYVVVANDAAEVHSRLDVSDALVETFRERLCVVGWEFDDD